MPELTPDEICLFDGAGFAACWGCPALQCPLRKDPAALSDEALSIALKAVDRLWDNDIVVEGQGGRSLVIELSRSFDPDEMKQEAAQALLLKLMEPAAQEGLRRWIAAEAVEQGLLDGRINVRTEQLWQNHARWLKKVNRSASLQEEAHFQLKLDAVAAQVAAEIYEALDVKALAEAIGHLHTLTKKATPEAQERVRRRKEGKR